MEKDKRLIDLTVSEFEAIVYSSSPQIPDIMDVDLCAQFLHKKPQTIYKYVSKDKIPYKKKDGSIYFLKSELIDWIKNGE